MEQNPAKLKRPIIIKTKGSVNTGITHNFESEMHRAISMCDKKLVNNLLKKGDKLCSGVDKSLYWATPNCFILAQPNGNWEFMKFLLSIDPEAGISARDYAGYTLLMMYAMYHKIEEVQHLLQLGADPNERSSDGNTALMSALSSSSLATGYSLNFLGHYAPKRKAIAKKCQLILDLLIQTGTDVDICNNDRENVLHLAVKNRYRGTFQLEIVRSLINAGVDPTVETNEHRTVISYGMERFTEICEWFRSYTIAKEAYATLHYLFKLPQFQSETFQITSRCSALLHPQSILLKFLSICQKFTGNKSIFFDLIVSNKNLLNPGLIVMLPFMCSNYLNLNHEVENIELPFGPLAYYLNNERYTMDPTSDKEMSLFASNLMENVQYLISVGLSVSLQTQETISPLTVGLRHEYPQFNYVAFAKNLMNSGVHVEQRMLDFHGLGEELEQLSAELCLPDALRLTLFQPHLHPTDVITLVEMFLPYFAHPGWTLLPFITSTEKVAALFPLLSSCGALQHTALHNAVKARILKSGLLSGQNLQTFNELNSCVPKLQEMCRTMERAQLARRACQHGNSLPALIKSVPPLVTPLNRLLDVAQVLK